MRIVWFLIHLACVGFASVSAVQAAQHRAALVIGNGAYPSSPLANPVNDAKDMAATLRKLGFEVIEVTNATQREMNRAMTTFGKTLRSDSVALFFYAGHGVQAKGKNYLLPVDAQIENEASMRSEGVDVDTVLDQIAATGSQVNIVILDACRNNPFERKFRGASGGLAQMDAPKGTLIAYATAPGKTANDGSGRNGLYTSQLLRALNTPGAKVEEVFKKVRIEVARSSNDQQIPWESSSLTGDFFFLPGQAPVPTTGGLRADDGHEAETWRFADRDKTLDGYAAYAALYPEGKYADVARMNLDRLLAAMTPAQRRKETERLTAKTNEALSLKQWRNAIRYGGSLLEIDPRNRVAAVALGAGYLSSGRLDDADRVVRRAVSIDPEASQLQNLLGAIRERQGRTGEARQAYDLACAQGSAAACKNASRAATKG